MRVGDPRLLTTLAVGPAALPLGRAWGKLPSEAPAGRPFPLRGNQAVSSHQFTSRKTSTRMRRQYDELLRLMEQDLQRAQEMWGRITTVPGASSRFWQPRVDVYETPNALIIKAELAGVRLDDLEVELVDRGRALLIRGQRGDPAEQRGERTVFHQMEIYLGPFERVVPLPANIVVDRQGIEAAYDDGFLLVRLPKLAPRPTRLSVEE